MDLESERDEAAHEERIEELLRATCFELGPSAVPEVAEPSDGDVAAAPEQVFLHARYQTELLQEAADSARWLGSALQLVIDFTALPTPQFVRKYGHGVTSREVADVARAALARARGGA